MSSAPKRRRRRFSRRTYAAPRASVIYVLRRTWMRLIEMQVWDVAGTMTFYAMLSVLPALVSIVSLVSLLGLQSETVEAAAELIHELVPTMEPAAISSAVLALGNTGGGVLGLVVGLLGSLYSASNVLAAFHRAMHRLYDTREGRPLLLFRARVLLETIGVMLVAIAVLLLITVGGEFSERLGTMLGFTTETVATWNTVKWWVILAVLIIGVSTAYYSTPNVKLPRYRLVTAGGAFTVLVLFFALRTVGWLLDSVGSFSQILTTLNGVIVIILMTWIATMVLIAGAAWDAEVLRARQLAAGLPAWDTLQLRTVHTRVLKKLDRQAADEYRVGRIIARAANTGEPVTTVKTSRLTESGSLFALNAGNHRLTTGTPYVRETFLSRHAELAAAAEAAEADSDTGESDAEEMAQDLPERKDRA
ncbi:YihY/virulence factor BrkB family protein [Citricoccus muralis]|uniref:YihY/virulence factor BrkB family protein n=1 Tax=Citricoccus muralis TaxID=169134 RepID=A0ABY8H4H2_9MICC|nr:YihY/virulence factor BrkB family protein [Citricoccus muralis]WFP16039.1 YihY/virulence factor BrkB family protein [Citricoccus muralis]